MRATTLEAVERRFTELSAPPSPLSIDGCGIGLGLPQRPIPLDELRIIMLKRQTGRETKDAVWRELSRRAQMVGEPWITGAIGMAMPMLKRIAGGAARGFRGEIDDFDSELVEGCLYALNTIDPEAPNILMSLRFMAQRYATEARISADRAVRTTAQYNDAVAARYRPHVSGHPDLVLAKAVQENGLTDAEASLISRAHLDGERTTTLADECGVSPYLFWQQLARAQDKLMRFLEGSVPLPAA